MSYFYSEYQIGIIVMSVYLVTYIWFLYSMFIAVGFFCVKYKYFLLLMELKWPYPLNLMN